MTPQHDRHDTHLRLPFEATSASTARHLLGVVLAERGVSRPVGEDAALIIHELVMNGIDHGRPDDDGTLLVSWEIKDDLLLILVMDHGTSGVVAPQSPSPERDHGRGLAIVDAISEHWSVVRDGGTTVSAWLRLAT